MSMSKKDNSVESRLENLEKELQRIKTLYERTLSYRDNDPETSLMHARKAAEAICRQLFIKEVSPNPGNLMLEDLIQKLTAAGVLPKDIAIPLRTIQGYGNFAMHDQDDNTRIITPAYIQPCLHALAVVVNWYVVEHQRYSAGVDGTVDQRADLPQESARTGVGSPPAKKNVAIVGQKPSEGAVTVSAFAASLGLTPAAVIRMVRDILHLELRTPSALLQKVHIQALEDALSSKQATGSLNSGMAPVRSFDLGSGVKIEFVLVPSGSLTMGSPVEEEGHNDDEIEHVVHISKPFYLSRCLVTQHQYKQVTGTNPSYFQGDNLPVEMVSWFDAVSFCEALSDRLGKRFRLPTEAEWEYACRGGTDTAFSVGNAITTEQANFDGKFGVLTDRPAVSRWKTTPVDTFAPNAWGLHDMHGNVWEWCSDWYGEYPTTEVTDPLGPKNADIRILRGGSWFHGPADARSAQRDALDPGRRHSIYGFRVVVEGGRE